MSLGAGLSARLQALLERLDVLIHGPPRRFVLAWGLAAVGASVMKRPLATIDLGLAVAVLVDATVVPNRLVPAARILATRWNWWPGAR